MSETPVVLPKWGLTMLDATLVEWLKQEGERVEVDDADLPRRDRQGGRRGDGAGRGRARPAARAQGRRRHGRGDADDDSRGRRLDAACASTTRSSGRATSRRWRTVSGSATGSRRSPVAATPAGARTTASSRSAGSYLEIIGVADENEALRDPMGRWLLANTATGDPLMGVVLRDRRHRAASRAGSASRSSAAAASGPTARGSRGASRAATRRSARGRSSSPGTSPRMRPGLLSAPHAVEVRGIAPGRGRLPRRGAARAGSPPTCRCSALGDGGGAARGRDRDRGRGDPPHRRFMNLG